MPNTPSPPPTVAGRLSQAEVEKYHRDGYVIFNQPVLPQAKFDGLKAYFEKMLADLPGDIRPEAMDVPHFMHPELLTWAFDEAILGLVRPLLGADLALFSTHFICKPKGNGRRVPWHEDSAYWKGMINGPTEVCTVWLAIDPSTRENGCMMVIPRTHVTGHAGFSDYGDVDATKNVFATEIVKAQRDDARRVYVELQANQASMHDGRIQHGSDANVSNIRRCGLTIRFASTATKFNYEKFAGVHQVYLACGKDLGGNTYADPTRSYPELVARRGLHSAYKHSH
jgi:hypothetical protein